MTVLYLYREVICYIFKIFIFVCLKPLGFKVFVKLHPRKNLIYGQHIGNILDIGMGNI